MCNYLVFGVVAFLVTSCQPRPTNDDEANYIEQPLDKKVKYHYQYGIEDADSGVLSHKWEERLGNYVKGAYSLMEPDGRIRTVDYEVDGPKGFRAVVRTSLPGNSFLSFQQLRTSRLTHSDPPVNILTNNPITKPVLDRQPRLIHKDLPPNFHSVKPDYFWGSLPHDHFKHAKTSHSSKEHFQQDHNNPSKTSPPSRAGKSLNRFGVTAPTTGFSAAATRLDVASRGEQTAGQQRRVENRDVQGGDRRGLANDKGGQSRRVVQPSVLMMPPRKDAEVMNYDHLLRAGKITDAVFVG